MASRTLQKALMLEVFEKTGEKIFIDNCRGCITDALAKLKYKVMFKSEEKINCDYKLKKDVLIYFNHTHYSNANLTNEIAKEILKVRGQRENFEVIPDEAQPVKEVVEVFEQKQAKKTKKSK